LTNRPQMDKPTDSNSVRVHNKLSANFRQIHVDGAFGGLTPKGFFNLNFFAERFTIPKSTDHEITESGHLGSTISNSEESKSGILREYEFGVYMSIEMAKSLILLMSQKIQDFEKNVTAHASNTENNNI
jgi:hypothetical protein